MIRYVSYSQSIDTTDISWYDTEPYLVVYLVLIIHGTLLGIALSYYCENACDDSVYLISL